MGASEPGNADRLDEAILLSVLSDVKKGDFSARMPLDWTGVPGKIADRLNDVIAANETLGEDLARVSRVVGREGKLSQRIAVSGSDRVWSESILSVNTLIDDLVRPTSEMQRVIGAVAGGDLSKHSSLVYLQRLPIDEIKVDRSFVMNLATVSSDAVIVRSTIDLAHNLGLTVVAEGVEDQVALGMLIEYGCDSAQGYLFSRPCPASELTTWLTESVSGVAIAA